MTGRRTACLRWGEPPTVEALSRALDALEAFSPRVEEGEAGCVYLDADGVAPKWGSEAAWCAAVLAATSPPGPLSMQWRGGTEASTRGAATVRVGVSETVFGAWMAAVQAPEQPGYLLISDERAFLAGLPVEHLPLSPEALRRLRLLGMRTMGRFAALPSASAAEQFGAEALIAHRWAKGLDERPVLGRRRQMMEASGAFESPEARREALARTAERLAERALRELPVDRRTWAIQRIEIEAETAEGATWRREAWLGEAPGAQTLREALGRLVEALGGEEESEGVTALGVRLVGLAPAPARQMDLFAHDDEAKKRLERALGRLAEKHTPECVLRIAEGENASPLEGERYRWRPFAP